MIRIGINASGGDFGFKAVGPAAVRAARSYPDIEIVLYSHCPMLDFRLKNLEFVSCHSANDELLLAINDLSRGKLNAVITASNSARLLVATSRHLQDGIKRPGLIAPFPTKSERKRSYIIDVGATAKVNDPEIYLGWARIGSDFLKGQIGIKNPLVGLQNIASERACPEIQAIDKVLQDFSGYIGYVEPKDFVDGKVDLLLTEGFLGNTDLKLVEEYTGYTLDMVANELADIPEASDRINAIRKKYLSYDAHLVSPLLGVIGGIIFRVHGKATHEQIAAAFGLSSSHYKL